MTAMYVPDLTVYIKFNTSREECSHGKQRLNRYVWRRLRKTSGDGQT